MGKVPSIRRLVMKRSPRVKRIWFWALATTRDSSSEEPKRRASSLMARAGTMTARLPSASTAQRRHARR
ncbi:hypothetical protein D3C78_1798420 [compost metagenome]